MEELEKSLWTCTTENQSGGRGLRTKKGVTTSRTLADILAVVTLLRHFVCPNVLHTHGQTSRMKTRHLILCKTMTLR